MVREILHCHWLSLLKRQNVFVMYSLATSALTDTDGLPERLSNSTMINSFGSDSRV